MKPAHLKIVHSALVTLAYWGSRYARLQAQHQIDRAVFEADQWTHEQEFWLDVKAAVQKAEAWTKETADRYIGGEGP